MLHVAGLTKRFGGFIGVNDASLTVPSNISPSLGVVKVKGCATREAV